MYDFNEFQDAFVKELEKRFPEKTFILRDVEKNNRTLKGVLVKTPDSNVAPTLYLDSAYANYQDSSMEEVVERMAETIMEAERNKDGLYLEGLNSPEWCKEHLICHLVRGDHNEKFLSDRPHRSTAFGELVLYVNVDSGDQHISSVGLNNQNYEDLLRGIFSSKEEAFAYAMENTMKLFPPKVQPMMQVIREIMVAQFGANLEEEKDFFDSLDATNESMFVLSNASGVCGAVALAYPENLKKFSDEIFQGKDMVVLPSSVHEAILVKPREDLGPKELLEMVRDVNQNQVPPEEVLADDAFYYKADTREVVRATDMIKELEKKKEKAKSEPER